jgi:hypothetical protein
MVSNPRSFLGAILPLASIAQFAHLEFFGCNFACGIKHPISHPFCGLAAIWHQTFKLLVWVWTGTGIPNLWT